MKIKNEYQKQISEELYKKTPKAVFAAIAVSYLVNFDTEFADNVDGGILQEWELLYMNGIVPQKPPTSR